MIKLITLVCLVVLFTACTNVTEITKIGNASKQDIFPKQELPKDYSPELYFLLLNQGDHSVKMTVSVDGKVIFNEKTVCPKKEGGEEDCKDKYYGEGKKIENPGKPFTLFIEIGSMKKVVEIDPRNLYDTRIIFTGEKILVNYQKIFEPNYFICEDPKNQEKIYEKLGCGDDSCWSNFYNKEGELIEETPEYGLGSGSEYEIKTKVKDCETITEEQFKKKVSLIGSAL
ncbi:MAG: hypothetical protein WC595_02450 [Candidatus Nanoarchaeia archaeon]